MKLVLLDEKDVFKLNGAYIAQFNLGENEPDIKTDFFLEKRIKHITLLKESDYLGTIPESNRQMVIISGFYTGFVKVFTIPDFIKYFNEYYPSKDEKITRYHRLLTDKELNWYLSKIKERVHE